MRHMIDQYDIVKNFQSNKNTNMNGGDSNYEYAERIDRSNQ